MLTKFRALAAGIALALAAALPASAATETDAVRYDALDLDVMHAVSSFDVTGPIGGPATLELQYGFWTGGGGDFLLEAFFNGTALASVTVSNAYFSPETSTVYDVSGLVIAGTNSLTVQGTTLGYLGTYAVGPATLEYDMSAVPLPAGLPLLMSGLLLVGAVRMRRPS